MPTGETNAPDDNVKLLVTIIQYMEGKPDWDAVAGQCGIVSAGAASKRYSRLLKSYDISPVKPAKAKATTTGKGKNTKATKPKDGVKDSGSSASGEDRDPSDAPKKEQKKRKAAGGAKVGKQTKKVKHEPIEEDSADAGEGAGDEHEDEMKVEEQSEEGVDEDEAEALKEEVEA
ncbi:hypothetical protein BDZ85DRAFT_322079 [Elsinoe ampelina]|uniref:Myb-like DNA-binding domain-containing protein n=1 Tax=Elsinoe ampelina TaxID=302913 RepID=A0A6A6G263_9PEZI|nr:hypothetical protein BDZ85DRAFT_322079 [Elsinoe ampelina]